MITHDLIQGSPEWHAYRSNHFNASDAPAMMGVSPYKTRAQLLDEYHTGMTKEFDAATQRRFDDGHRFERLARALAEKIVGEELYPVTGSIGRYSASFDGLTIDESINFEHKSLNDDLRRVMVDGCTGSHLPMMYRMQMEQQHLVSGAEKTLFMASKWDGEELIEERHCWYEPDLELRERIIAGWEQFEADLATHVPTLPEAMPKAEVHIELPALFIQAHGNITSSNMKEYGEALALRLKEVREIVLVEDQDFSNAKEAAKMFRDQIQKLKMAKEAMLSQTVSIGEAARMIDSWAEDLRVTALQLEKDVEREDLTKKNAMIHAALLSFKSHVEALEGETRPVHLNVTTPDFAGAIKGKRNYASMQEAVDTALRNGKFDADTEAKDIRDKLAWCKSNAEGYGFLFPDLPQIITKPMDDFKLVVDTRISHHKAAEATKAEAERQRRIRDEEAAKLKAEADAKAAEEIAENAKQNAQSEDIPHKLVTGDGGAAPLNPATVVDLQQAVIEHQDDISSFMASRDFGKESNKVRAILVEFVKWQAGRCMKQAA